MATKRAKPGSRKILIDTARELPGATEDIKWGADLVFSVGEKMFACTGMDPSSGASFKCEPLVYEALTRREGVVPCGYNMWKHGWVAIDDWSAIEADELARLVRTSHKLVLEKLSKTKQRAILGEEAPKKAARSRK